MIRCIVALAIIAGLAPAHAEPASAQAEVLFREGRNLMAAGKLAEACTAFEESQKLGPAVTTLINLAGCREKLGELATAWGLFLDAERQTRSAVDEATKQLHDVARDRAAKLESRVSKLTIVVPDASRVAGLTITRGDAVVDPAMWGHALPIDGGTHTIAAKAPGMAPWSAQVAVGAEADAKTIEVPALQAPSTPEPPHGPAVAPPIAPPTHANVHAAPEPTSPPYLAIGLGVGALALAGGGVAFEVSARSTYDQAKAELTSQARRDSLYDSANHKRYLAEGLGVAGVAAGAAAVWFYLHRGGEQHVVVSSHGVAYARTF